MTLLSPSLTALGLVVTRLQTMHAATVTDFCRRCSAFFELVTGESDAAKIATELLDKGPPGVDPSRKHVLGIERDDRLVGIVHLIEDFPTEGAWYLGTLLLLPDERNRGTGRAIWTAIETCVHSSGGRVLRLIVQEQNPRAASFWTSLDFVTDGQVPQLMGSRANLCWRFEKHLRDAPAHHQCRPLEQRQAL